MKPAEKTQSTAISPLQLIINLEIYNPGCRKQSLKSHCSRLPVPLVMWSLQHVPCSFTCCWCPSYSPVPICAPQGCIPQLLGLSKDGKLPERKGVISMDMWKNELIHVSNHLHMEEEAMALPRVTSPQGVVFHAPVGAGMPEGGRNLLLKPPHNWYLPHILLEEELSSSSAGNTPDNLLAHAMPPLPGPHPLTAAAEEPQGLLGQSPQSHWASPLCASSHPIWCSKNQCKDVSQLLDWYYNLQGDRPS